MIPRADIDVRAPDVCLTAVDSINLLGGASPYYNYLSLFFCTPAGGSQPPFNGWNFTGSFEDGWR